jgi:hypothetical protein
MTLLIELAPEVENRLTQEAERLGLPPAEYASRLIARELLPPEYDLDALLALPPAERARLLSSAAEDAAPLYQADLALPVAERELTAFTSLDAEPFHEYED